MSVTSLVCVQMGSVSMKMALTNVFAMMAIYSVQLISKFVKVFISDHFNLQMCRDVVVWRKYNGDIYVKFAVICNKL